MTNEYLIEEYVNKITQDPRILKAFENTPREVFVPENFKDQAYEDRALPIGEEQTISQPSLVAAMTHLLNLKGDEKVLEIGTGSGYQATILARLAKEVYTIEIVEKLHKRSKKIFTKLGLDNIHPIFANGSVGYKEASPYDAIIVTAGAKKIPLPLLEQLKDGGRIVIPQGDSPQDLILKIGYKKGGDVEFQNVDRVQFVPLKGKEGSFES